MPPALIPILIVAPIIFILSFLAYRRFIIAQPDEWLLRIRQGKVLDAGIGVHLWRWPGDLVVRFSSTMQRVSFSVEVLSSEKLNLHLEGFIFWSVSSEEGAPFQAFQKLGLADLEHPPPGLKHPKHLLTGAQHKALQQLIIASVQNEAASFGLQELLLGQEKFKAQLHLALEAAMNSMGARVDQLQLLQARPVSEDLLQDLSVEENAKIREQAEQTRLESEDRIARTRLDLQLEFSQKELAFKRVQEAQRLELELEQLKQRAKAREKEQALKGDEAQRQHALNLESSAQEHALYQSRLEMSRERALYEESSQLPQEEAQHARLELELARELEGLRRRAEAKRDQGLSLAQIEESKSDELRRYELQHKVAEKMAEAIQIRDGRWVSLGKDSPIADLGAALGAMMEAVSKEL